MASALPVVAADPGMLLDSDMYRYLGSRLGSVYRRSRLTVEGEGAKAIERQLGRSKHSRCLEMPTTLDSSRLQASFAVGADGTLSDGRVILSESWAPEVAACVVTRIQLLKLEGVAPGTFTVTIKPY